MKNNNIMYAIFYGKSNEAVGLLQWPPSKLYDERSEAMGFLADEVDEQNISFEFYYYVVPVIINKTAATIVQLSKPKPQEVKTN